MSAAQESPLARIEPRLRTLLPAALYTDAWLDPSPNNLMRVFQHLRTLQRILHDYLPRMVSESLPKPGEIRSEWQTGTLMFTDLAGFTPLMEANAARGRAGAETLLSVLNAYFAAMIEIISKSGGNLLEFTGDALLAQFPTDRRHSDTAQAVRAGLRMQRAMERFANIETEHGALPLGMRIGIHAGRFLAADIGTPRRMAHVLLGNAALHAKHAEGAGRVGRVCLTQAAYEQVRDEFRFEPGDGDYMLVKPDLSDEQLGEYDIALTNRRAASLMLFDRSLEGLVNSITEAVQLVEPLASYLPGPVLNLLVESTAQRQIRPEFPKLTVVFVNFIGLPESVDYARPPEIATLVSSFSHTFALINAAVAERGGIVKNVTYHLSGSDMVIYFGTPNAHTDDQVRAARASLAIRDIVANIEPPTLEDHQVEVSCRIGMARGSAFAAEIGEPRGRREFNVLGDTVNTAARLMNKAVGNRILITEAVHQEIASQFKCEPLGPTQLKGKSAPIPLYELQGVLEENEITKSRMPRMARRGIRG